MLESENDIETDIRTGTDTVLVEPPSETVTEPGVVTDTASDVTTSEPTVSDDAEPPVDAYQTVASDSPRITTKTRTGFRKVRGKRREVNLPFIDVLIDDVVVAFALKDVGRPVMVVAEILPEERPLVVDAIMKARKDTDRPDLKIPPKLTDDQVRSLTAR